MDHDSEIEPVVDALPRQSRSYTSINNTDHSTNDETKHLPKGRRWYKTIIVEPLIALMFFCSIGALPLVEQYIYSRFAKDYPVLENYTKQALTDKCSEINSTDSDIYNATEAVQTRTSHWMMYLNLMTFVPSLFTTLVIGGYSDAHYRKVALIVPTVGLLVRITTAATVIFFDLHLFLLAAAYIFDGICGSSGTLSMACLSYIADIINSKSRAFRIVLLDVVLAVAGAASGFCIGLMIKHYGFFIPSAMMVIIMLISLLYVIFVIPETQRPLPGTRFVITDILMATWRTYTKPGSRRMKLALVIAMLLFSQLPLIGDQATQTLYQMSPPLCWGPDTIGIYMTAALCLIEFGSVVGSGLFRRCLKESYICLIGDLSGIAAYLFYSNAKTTVMMFFVPVFGLFLLLPGPLAKAIGSSLVPTNEQGALFAGMSVFYNITSITSFIAFNYIYTRTFRTLPTAVFIVCAGCYVIAFVITVVYIFYERKDKSVPDHRRRADDDE